LGHGALLGADDTTRSRRVPAGVAPGVEW
jgi:hypothetical protein